MHIAARSSTQPHLVSGYTVCGLYTSQIAGSTVFDPRLTHWIQTFYAVAVVQSTMTTGLMAYKIWVTDRRSASYRADVKRSSLLPVLRILLESASLQLFVEIILLALYLADYNAQYILLEIVTPLVVRPPSPSSLPSLLTETLVVTTQGITFTAITIRLSLRMSGALDTTKVGGNSTVGLGATGSTQIATIGSMPMRPIAINITKDVHDDAMSESDGPAPAYRRHRGTGYQAQGHGHHRKMSSMELDIQEIHVVVGSDSEEKVRDFDLKLKEEDDASGSSFVYSTNAIENEHGCHAV